MSTEPSISFNSKDAQLQSILVVEDDRALNDLIIKTLKRKTYHTLTAYTGKDAIAKITGGNVLFVLLDYKLPDMTAVELLEELEKKGMMVPFMIMTGYGDEEIAVSMMKKGAVDYLVKDTRFIDVLTEKIDHASSRILEKKMLQDAENALRERETFLRELLNAIPSPVFHRDKNGRYKGINNAYANFFGKKEEEVLGKTVYDVYPPALAKQFTEQDEKLMRSGGIHSYELPVKNKKGEERDLVINKAVVKSPNEDIIGLIGILHDITDLRTTEKELDRRVKKMQTITEMSINLTNASEKTDPCKLIANEFQRITGAGLTSVNLYDAKKRVLIVQYIAGDQQKLVPINTILRKDLIGYEIPVKDDDHKRIVKGKSTGLLDFYSLMLGQVSGEDAQNIQQTLNTNDFFITALMAGEELMGTAAAAGSQISTSEEIIQVFRRVAGASLKQRQVEKALKESEQKFRTITENSADAIFLTDEKGNYQYVNTMATKLLDYSREELLRMNVAEVSMEENTSSFATPKFVKLMKEGYLATELKIRKKDGTLLPVDLNAVVLPNGLVYGSCRDISIRKKTEQELIKAKEKAEEGDRLKSAFLANMSHEIRTPMNGILGFANLLNNPDLSTENQQEYIRMIEKSGERMLNIINDLINIAEIESGQIKIIRSESNINEEIRYLYDFFKPETDHKKLVFTCHTPLPDEEALIQTDHDKLLNILTNLIKNAIKFTKKGRIDFGYQIEGDQIHFYIKDTGIGIPKEKQQSIFERFVQADMNLARSYEGSGLGLSITKAYVEKMEGCIWVESEEGRGTAFHFKIPFSKKSRAMDTLTIEEKENTKQTADNLKLLVAEDDQTSVRYLGELLGNECREILYASNGQEAIELYENNKDIDVILMDIKMPLMDGHTATKKIREFDQEVIIIAQTAYAMKGDRKKAIDAGCNGYITKPISKDNLMKIIRENLDWA